MAGQKETNALLKETNALLKKILDVKSDKADSGAKSGSGA